MLDYDAILTHGVRTASGIVTAPLASVRRATARQREPMRQALLMMAAPLTVDACDADVLAARWCDLLQCEWSDEAVLIAALRAAMSATDERAGIIEHALRERAALIAREIQPWVNGPRLLDWGCGDGKVFAELVRLGLCDHRLSRAVDVGAPPVHLEDVYARFDETTGLVEGLSQTPFDAALLLTVLHHAMDPGRTLHACLSAHPERVIVIESVPLVEHESWRGLPAGEVREWQFEYCGFVDWFYNRVICADVQVTFNYLLPDVWRQLFAAAGRVQIYEKQLGIDLSLVPEWHSLMVFE